MNTENHIIPFEELPTSTTTTIVYSNIGINLENIFHNIDVHSNGYGLIKKHRKTVVAPYGMIVYVQHGIYFRGTRMGSNNKKYWCPTCQIYNDKGKKVLTISEEEAFLKDKEAELFQNASKKGGGFAKKLLFKCKKCNSYHERKNLGKIVTFLNQLTIVMAIDGMFVTAMFFKSKNGSNVKLSGTKHSNDVAETMMLLWENYFQPHPDWWNIVDDTTATVNDDSDIIKFCFDPTMRNVDFKLDFPIDKCGLNSIMNEAHYTDKIYLSQHEATSATHVNIKTHTQKPDDYLYDVLVYNNGEFYFETSPIKLYAPIKEKVKKSLITFIVFSSAEVILSGRYFNDMKAMYEFFVKTAYARKSEIMEVICAPINSLREWRKEVGW